MNFRTAISILVIGLASTLVMQAQKTGLAKITVDQNTQKRLGIHVADLATLDSHSQITAFGEVMDVTPLLRQWLDLQTSKLLVLQADRIATRTAELAKADHLSSEQSLEMAELDLQTTRLKYQTARNDLRLTWGLGDFNLITQDVLDRLLEGNAVVVRLAIPIGVSIPTVPESVNVWPTGSPLIVQSTKLIWPAPMTNKSRSPGYFALLGKDIQQFPAGLGVLAKVDLEGESQKMFVIPDEAVVYHLGSAWIYQQTENDHFQRQWIGADIPSPEGWLAPMTVLDPQLPAVVQGAQGLLSTEILMSGDQSTQE